MIAQRLHGVPGYDAFKYQLCLRSPLREIKMDMNEKCKIIGVSSELRTQSPFVPCKFMQHFKQMCADLQIHGNTFNLPYFNISVYINK